MNGKTEKGAPMASGEIFGPEDRLREIKRLPKEERKEKIAEFKEKLRYQKIGIAGMQTELAELISRKPDAALPELNLFVEKTSSFYGLTREQKEIIKNVLRRYVEKHELLANMRRVYPDDRELFRAVFGRHPQGEVEAVARPLMLYFRCRNQDDYAFIHSYGFLENREPTAEEKERTKDSGALVLGSVLPRWRGLEMMLGAENSGRLRELGGVPETAEEKLRHEEQHAAQALQKRTPAALKKMIENNIVMERFWSKTHAAENEKEFADSLRKYLRASRWEKAEERAGGEILAHFREDWTPEAILKDILLPRKNGGIYDYLAPEKEKINDAFREKHWDKFRPSIESVLKKVYEDEYKIIVRDGIKALRFLLDAGCQKEQIIALLMWEPLSRWKKTSERLIAKKPA